ncbi:Uncharacterised protein [Vibrio cholerae]|nr:Uncharacterised protein [Vibrio cholerae]
MTTSTVCSAEENCTSGDSGRDNSIRCCRVGLFSEEDIAATAKSGKPTSVAFFRIESSENRKIIDLDITSLPVEKSQNSAKSKGFSAVCHLRFRQKMLPKSLIGG